MPPFPDMKARPFPDELLRELAERHGTPLYVYDAAGVREHLARLFAAGGGRGFDVVRYAQKANPNLALLRLLREGGALVDAVSAGELARAMAAGWQPEQITFCADLFDRAAVDALASHPCAITVGSADMLEWVAALRAGGSVALRVNPGFGSGHHAKVSTGGEASKHGVWHGELATAVARARALGLTVNGLHVHIGSGVDLERLATLRESMRSFARLVGSSLEWISCGGGLPIPYRESERAIDVDALAGAWNATREAVEGDLGRRMRLEVEPGRWLVAQSGVLLAEVRGRKRSGDVDFILVDAGFNDLLRPALYGAYHQISIVGRDGEPAAPRVVAGPLCESGDVFTQGAEQLLAPQPLPDARPGDLACLHDAGAYGFAMASTYNSRPLAAEVLVDRGEARLVRRRQSLHELLEPELELLDDEP
jgi:diaminopimelate decarboxylase